jgi:hypothetical protein
MRTAAMIAVLAAPLWAGIEWERDLGKARERAIREDKLLFLDFSADW